MASPIPGNVDGYIHMVVDEYAGAGMKIPCLIRSCSGFQGSAGAKARALGLEVGSSIGTIYPAFLPADWNAICQIAALDCVDGIEASR